MINEALQIRFGKIVYKDYKTIFFNTKELNSAHLEFYKKVKLFFKQIKDRYNVLEEIKGANKPGIINFQQEYEQMKSTIQKLNPFLFDIESFFKVTLKITDIIFDFQKRLKEADNKLSNANNQQGDEIITQLEKGIPKMNAIFIVRKKKFKELCAEFSEIQMHYHSSMN